jgi:hypothetical protein
MRIGLVEFPRRSTLPNVALMRLSAYHKALGDQVTLNATPFDHPDVVYLSTLFTWQRRAVEEVAAQFRPHTDVQIGGPGVLPLPTRLPAAVDAMPNDYDLFDVEFGIGYSSRGCIRHCRFCPVPKMEGGIREVSAIAELLNPRSNRLLLLDNNFFASDWLPKIAEIRERGLDVCWPQGLDIRLLDADQATALADLRHRGQLWNQRFTRRGVLHFAWDLPSNEARSEEVVRGIRLLFACGFTPSDLSFMVLIGFPGYSLEDELERVTTLQRLGIQPYVMVYRDFGERDRRDPRRMDLQHWNNGHVWRTVAFQDYRRKAA